MKADDQWCLVFVCNYWTAVCSIWTSVCVISGYNSFLLFARRSDIRVISYDTNIQADVILPLQGLRSAVAIDFEPDSNQIVWTDVTLDTISTASVNGKNQRPLISNSLDSPAGLAIDWVNGKVYWTDAGTDRIEIANIDGTYRTVVVWKDLDRPRDVITDPLDGYLYWTDWGAKAKISRSYLDGSNQHVLVDTNLIWPNGLTIEHSTPTKHLYWADAGKKWIETSNVDGTNRRRLITFQLPHPFGITLHGQVLYWTDWQTKSIQQALVRIAVCSDNVPMCMVVCRKFTLLFRCILESESWFLCLPYPSTILPSRLYLSVSLSVLSCLVLLSCLPACLSVCLEACWPACVFLTFQTVQVSRNLFL